jgi:hypothetical protein
MMMTDKYYYLLMAAQILETGAGTNNLELGYIMMPAIDTDYWNGYW